MKEAIIYLAHNEFLAVSGFAFWLLMIIKLVYKALKD